ncbi:MAG: hypothetical protein WD532_00645, partial [Acidimicrobiia bacterium]
LVGVALGLPEFLQARGLFVDLDDVGPRRVVAFGGGFVLVGSDTDGAMIWYSADGVTWSAVDDPALVDLEVRDVVVVDGRLVALGALEEPTQAVILVSSDGRHWERHEGFGNVDHGTVPEAISRSGEGLAVVADIIGNDVEFYTTPDLGSWTVSEPVGEFDDGESGEDIACSDAVCVAVGSHHAAYRSELAADVGVAWVNTGGDRFDLVDHDFESEILTHVVWADPGFVVGGNDSSRLGVVWHSEDGRQWTRLAGPFEDARFDGVEATTDGYLIFGSDRESGAIWVWESVDGLQWAESVLSAGLPAGSHVRSVAAGDSLRVAVGVDSETRGTVVWTSPRGGDWSIRQSSGYWNTSSSGTSNTLAIWNAISNDGE